jgi:hypothetical protein
MPHGNPKKVVELLLCLLSSNASVERVLFHMNYMWFEEKFRFHVDTIQCILAVKMNTDLSYEAFSEKLASNPGVQKGAHSSGRYHTIAMNLLFKIT